MDRSVFFNGKHLSHFRHPHYANLVREFTFCEFKLRDQSTLLGFLWTLLHPTLLFAVLYALFVKWMGNRMEFFGLYLILGVVQWNYFANGTNGGLRSIIGKSSLISNFVFPQDALVVSSVMTSLLIHGLELAVTLLFFLAFGAAPSGKWVLLPVMVAIETTLILGVSFFLARLAVQYRDAVRIWEIVTMIGFFVTPIFFPLDIIAPDRRQILLVNPMARLINESRQFMIYDAWPSPAVLFSLLLVALLFLMAGYRFFKQGEPNFAEKFP